MSILNKTYLVVSIVSVLLGQDSTKIIIGKKIGPLVKDLPDLDNPEATKRKLILRVELVSSKAILEYIPNMTSVKAMTSQYGYDMNAWVGKAFEWETAITKVKGNDVTCLYVKEDKVEL